MKLLLIFVLLILHVVLGVPRESPRIAGGKVAGDGQFPWAASIRNVNKSYGCGGTIINHYYVLTTAKCIASGFYTWVGTGTVRLQDPNTQYYEIYQQLSHPKFSMWTYENDVGLISVKSPIQFSELVQPIPLETSKVGNLKCTVAGWGRAIYPHSPRLEMLHYLEVNTIGNEECERKLTDSKIPITNSSLCTLTKVGQGICLGDSGGPLVADGKVVGVASWITGGFPCAIGKPDVFTRISHVLGWVLENSNSDALY